MVKDRKIRKLITEIVDKIKKENEPEKIILFGSYACGTPTEDSDIDLFIVKDTDKRRVDRFVEVKTWKRCLPKARYFMPDKTIMSPLRNLSRT